MRQLQKERITLVDFQEQLSQIDKSLRALPATAQVCAPSKKVPEQTTQLVFGHSHAIDRHSAAGGAF